SGISLIINYITDIRLGVLIVIINIPIFILGYKFIDKEFIVYSIIGMLTFSIFLDIFRFLQGSIVVDDVLLSSVFGGLFNGIGAGIVFRNRGSQGGSDIISVIVKKHFSMNIGTTLLVINVVIVSSSIFIFKDINKAMYTLIMMFVSTMVMDKVAQGFDIRKSIMIVTDSYEQVAKGIIEELGRGVTYLNGEGAYSGTQRKIIYCIINLNQLAKIKKIVFEIDSKAFITVADVSEVNGKGFAIKGI
ncbi:MAG: YitT family protein, partial [Filifactoraceae bacterium]